QDALPGWTIRMDSLDELRAVSERLKLPVVDFPPHVVRLRPDGYSLELHAVADTAEVWPKGLPNFIFWDNMAEHPGRATVDHRVRPGAITWMETGGNEAELREWIGPDIDRMPLRFVPGTPGLHAAAVATAAGEVVFRPATA
ncbi:MAG: VOC family protein, partial [Chloroflexi bacterium]|nr:VOC family protein [Chloroflexota bacterium]